MFLTSGREEYLAGNEKRKTVGRLKRLEMFCSSTHTKYCGGEC
jgi:hypothetical protein